MRRLTLEAQELSPIQSAGVSSGRLLQELSEDPIEVIFYQGKFLILDGHHRAYDAASKDQSIGAFALETDQDVLDAKAISLVGCRTIQDVIDKYLKDWLPGLTKKRIFKVLDMPVHRYC